MKNMMWVCWVFGSYRILRDRMQTRFFSGARVSGTSNIETSSKKKRLYCRMSSFTSHK
jgi:hypothetical protein